MITTLRITLKILAVGLFVVGVADLVSSRAVFWSNYSSGLIAIVSAVVFYIITDRLVRSAPAKGTKPSSPS